MPTASLPAYPKPAHAELVEARTDCGACLDKLGMSGAALIQRERQKRDSPPLGDPTATG